MRRTPEEIVGKALDWIAQDYAQPDCRFDRLIDICDEATRSGWKRIKRGDVYILAQMNGLAVSMDDEFARDNTLWAPLSRYIIMLRPHLAEHIFPKLSTVDGVDLERAWHERIDPSTRFPARSWREARRACRAGEAIAEPEASR